MGATATTGERLRWHAGLITDCPDSGGSSVDELLFEGQPAQEEFAAAIDEVVRTLQSLNIELNGQRPSESVYERNDEVPRSVAYAISEMASRLRSKAQADAAWTIEFARNAVLAGDIDDVQAHVRQGRAAS